MSHSGSRKIDYAADLKLPECVHYLESIARGLRQGRVTLTKGDSRVSLAPAAAVHVEIEAKRKPKKRSLRVELSWQRGDSELSAVLTRPALVAVPRPNPPIVAPTEALLPARGLAADERNGTERDHALDLRAMLGSLSKDELYEKAQRLEIAGRSSMKKDELVDALLQHEAIDELVTREELYAWARAADLAGRSTTTKAALLDHLERPTAR